MAFFPSIIVGYHLPFQHNELSHLPYMPVALIPDQTEISPDQATISLRLKSVSHC